MHYQDLSICDYDRGHTGPSSWSVPLLAIGWLESGNSYNVGSTSEAFQRKLIRLKEQSLQHCYFAGYRGTHGCSLCELGTPSHDYIEGSHKHLLIPGVDCVYVASGGITHYVTDHSYQPPEGFIEAVDRCPEVDSTAYRELLRSSHIDEAPLAFNSEEAKAAFRARILRRRQELGLQE